MDKKKPNRLKGRRQKLFISCHIMDQYVVRFRQKNGGSVNGYHVQANGPTEAADKWRETSAGKSGRCEIIEVYRVGSR